MPGFRYRLGDEVHDLTSRTLVMGILNRTPDSFYDKGLTFELDSLLERAEVLVNQGADLLDVGGVKAGPGPEVGEDEELDRVVAPIAALHARFDVAISCDTWRASVLDEACKAGAVVGNDISGFGDPAYLAVAARHDASVVATHIRLQPRVPDPEPHYDDLLGDVTAFLLDRARRAEAVGLAPEQIALDAGLDLGKTPGAERGAAARERRPRRSRVHAPAVVVEQALPRGAARSRHRRPARRVAGVGRVRRRPRLSHRAGARRRRFGGGVPDGRGAGARVSATYLVKGTDPSLRDRVVADLVTEILGADDPTLALEDITIPGRAGAGAGEDTEAPVGADGRDAAVAALLNAVGSPPFMTEHRVVVARDVGALTAGDVDGIVRYLDDPLDTTILVFVAGGGTMPPALTKKLKEIKAEERAPESEKTDKVLIAAAHEAGVLLTADAARLITSHLGDDAGRVAALVDVLASAADTGTTPGCGRGAPLPRRSRSGAVVPADQRDRGG